MDAVLSCEAVTTGLSFMLYSLTINAKSICALRSLPHYQESLTPSAVIAIRIDP